MRNLVVAFALVGALVSCKSPPPATAIKSLSAVPPDTRTVRKIGINKAAEFDAAVHGYVWKGWSCPPCPEGAVCHPCFEPEVVLGDTKTRPNAPVVGTAIYELRVRFRNPPPGSLRAGDHIWVKGRVGFDAKSRTLEADELARIE
jgi:hypothetical protein